MQDLYAFDIGDFGKLGLLRALTEGSPRLKLGVIWYATNLGSAGADGKHIRYLALGSEQVPRRLERTLRVCDRTLYDSFRRHLRSAEGGRTISALEQLGVLAEDTRFVSSLVPENSADRERWFHGACAHVNGSDLVFVDPDNGLEPPGRSPSRGPSRIHVTWSELRVLYEAGHSLVIYHHLNRERGGHELQTANRLEALRASLEAKCSAWALRYRRGTARAFFVIAQQRHAAALERQVGFLRGSAWVERSHLVVT